MNIPSGGQSGVRRLRISPEFLADFLTRPTPPGITSDAPGDLRIVDCRWARPEDQIELLVSSDSFNDPADSLYPPPLWDLHFHTAKPTGGT